MLLDDNGVQMHNESLQENVWSHPDQAVAHCINDGKVYLSRLNGNVDVLNAADGSVVKSIPALQQATYI